MKILIGYDGSDHANAAIEDLRRAGLPREVTALIVSVSDALLPPLPPSSHEIIEKATSSRRALTGIVQEQARASQALEQALATALEGSKRVRSIFQYWGVATEGMAGTPSEALLQKAKDWEADLIVVGSQGRSALGQLLIGSASKKVATDAHCSVRVARPLREKAGAPVRLVIGFDGSPGARLVVRSVASRAWPAGSEARVIIVDDRSEPTGVASEHSSAPSASEEKVDESLVRRRKMGEEAVEELDSAAGLNASFELTEGDPQSVLPEAAERSAADCIFVGARGFYGSLEQPGLGTVSTGLVTSARCSVEVVRAAKEAA